MFLGALKAAHQRLFAHVGWLRERLLGTVEEYARGITVDTSGSRSWRGGIDPSNPAAIRGGHALGDVRGSRPPRRRGRRWAAETCSR